MSDFHDQILALLFSRPIVKQVKSRNGNGKCILFDNQNLYYISDDKIEIRFIEKNVLDLYTTTDGCVYYKTKDTLISMTSEKTTPVIIVWYFQENYIREDPSVHEYIDIDE